MKWYVFLPVLAGFSVWSGCALKAPVALPPVTDTGANTFGCYMDGIPLVPAMKDMNWSAWWQVKEYQLFFIELKPDGADWKLEIDLDIHMKDTLRMAPVIGDSMAAYVLYATPALPGQKTDSYRVYTRTPDNGAGAIRLTRFSDSVVSGEFWFDLVDKEGRDTVRLRQGRFDVKTR